jgi:hypothetical protein
MENPESLQQEIVKNKIITFSTSKLILIAVIVYTLGAVTLFFLDPFLPAIMSHTKKAYVSGVEFGRQAGFEESKKLVEKSSFMELIKEQSSDMYTISGTIISIQGNSFVLRDGRVRDPSETDVIQERTIVVPSTSQIFTMTTSEKKSDKELQSMLLKMATSSSGTVSPYIKTKSDFSSLAVGMNVTVTAKENIKKLQKFEALEVQVIPKIEIK